MYKKLFLPLTHNPQHIPTALCLDSTYTGLSTLAEKRPELKYNVKEKATKIKYIEKIRLLEPLWII